MGLEIVAFRLGFCANGGKAVCAFPGVLVAAQLGQQPEREPALFHADAFLRGGGNGIPRHGIHFGIPSCQYDFELVVPGFFPKVRGKRAEPAAGDAFFPEIRAGMLPCGDSEFCLIILDSAGFMRLAIRG